MFTLSQALSAIKDKPEFSAKDKGSYTVIDYNLSTRDTFTGSSVDETMILLNLRGTAFDNKTGEIIRLAYHKFFNYGEFPELDAALNFNDAHTITQKLDGSMIAPMYTREGIILGTRAGRTDIADMASDFAVQTTNYVDLIFKCSVMFNATPIFEFCSRKNRVVLDYPEDQLVLTGVRFMDNGEYMSRKNVVALGKEYDVPVVKQFSSTDQNHFANLRAEVASLLNDEGIVIRFESGQMAGHMVKIKADQYVKMHKAVDSVKWDHDICQLILNGLIDDVIPILMEDKAKFIINYNEKLLNAISKKSKEIINLYKDLYHPDRKTFAIRINDHECKQYFFKLHNNDSLNVYDLIIATGKKKCNNIKNTNEFYKFINFNLPLSNPVGIA